MINNKYISRALNPSVSNQPEAQSAVHVQFKLSKLHIQFKASKQRNQRRSKKPLFLHLSSFKEALIYYQTQSHDCV